MTSGMPFSEREIAFVRTHHKGLFASSIADQLVVRFPEDNGGSRDKESVKRLIKRLGLR